MNRLVLIGNGFDLAHGLKTSYADFINWYWDQRVKGFHDCISYISRDTLCEFKDLERHNWKHNAGYGLSFIQGYNTHHFARGVDVVNYIHQNPEKYRTSFSPLLQNIWDSLQERNWVDIENVYYELLKLTSLPHPGVATHEDLTLPKLNEQLQFLQDLLIKYLKEISQQEISIHPSIRKAIYAPVETKDIAIEAQKTWLEEVQAKMEMDERKLDYKRTDYGLTSEYLYDIQDYKKSPWESSYKDFPDLARLPDSILLLNFNYTNIPEKYLNRKVASIVSIHGVLDKPDSIIFGYGDEIDPSFKALQNLNNSDCLKNVKSMRYLEAPNYRKVLSFIESAPFQVLIMGHSCGNSDRTLLNTIFEDPHCVSIKPYFYQKDDGSNNYIELVQNISRNFTDMKLMRDRVVNRTQCEPLVNE